MAQNRRVLLACIHTAWKSGRRCDPASQGQGWCPLYDLSENVSATARGVATLFWLEERLEIDCDMLLRISKSEDTNW